LSSCAPAFRWRFSLRRARVPLRLLPSPCAPAFRWRLGLRRARVLLRLVYRVPHVLHLLRFHIYSKNPLSPNSLTTQSRFISRA
jgi:hypothetical protein